MAVKLNNFSKTQTVLDTNDWEGLRIINEQSKATKLVSTKLHEVVDRLLSKSRGQYNINDFEFLVTDESSENAFYISDSKTKNNKYVISVSSGLINKCTNEDEFAGVIGHELGHFVYDKLSNSGKNTVFQERGSDLHSVDLLIDGGYDPLAYENIAGKIFLKNRSNVLNSLGVHGNDFARVEDIRSYLTYLKKEQGEFKKANKFSASDWKLFQKEFNENFKNSRFKSYLDQKLISKIKTDDLNPDNFSDALDVIINEVKKDNITISSRVSDLQSKLNVFDHNYRDYTPSKEVREKLQTLLEIIVSKNPDKEMMKILDNLKWINKEYFDLFGEFKELSDDLQTFIDATNIKTAKEIANKWGYNLGKIYPYKNIFQFPAFIMPAEKDAIGQGLPYDKHKQWAKESPEILNLLRAAFRISDDTYLNDDYLTELRWPYKKPYNYLLGDDGKIFLTGEKVTEYNRKLSDKNYIIQNQKKAKENHIGFINQLDILNALADFKDGKKTADDFWKIFSNYHKITNNQIIYKIINTYYNQIRDNKYETEDYNLALESKAYKKFAQIPNSLKINLKEMEEYKEYYEEDNISIKTVFLDSVFRREANSEFLTNIIDVLLKLIEQTEEKDQLNKADLTKELYEQTSFSLSGRIYERTLNSTKILSSEVTKIQHLLLEKVRNKFTDLADPVKFFYIFNRKELGLKHTINTQLKNNEPTPLLDKIFDKIGIPVAKNPKEFDKNKLKIIYQLRQFNLDFPIGYYFVKCLKQDLPIIDDLEHFFDYHHNGPYIYDDSFEQDELARYIRKHNLFPKNDFKKAFKIYQNMESLKWFSKNESNQSEIINILIDNIKTMNVDDREKYSFLLLSGISEDKNYIRNDADLRFPNCKKELMTIFTDSVFEQFGKDDGSDEYKQKFSDIINLISKDSEFYFKKRYYPNSLSELKKYQLEDLMYDRIISDKGNSRDILSKTDKAKLFRLLSDKIVSQEVLSQTLGKKRTIAVGDKDAQSNDFKARAFEGFLAFLEQNNKRSVATIEFLNRRLTPDSMQIFKTTINDGSASTETQDKYLNTEFLELVYNSFWDEDLGFRSLVMNKLLNRISNKSDETEKIKDQIAYVCNMHFPKGDKYRKDAEFIFETAIMSFEPFERSLILSAIASADENKDEQHSNAAKSVGAGLRMFFENMGPAWVKFGQLLSYVPELPSEIREDLGKLKDKADIPARWDLFNSIKNTLPNELLKNIISVDEILGAGSFWVTAKIQFLNKDTGVVEDKVVSLLRPYALERSMSGFKTIEKSVSILAKSNSKYRSLLKVAQQAKASAEYEVDVVYGNKQFEKAKQLYGNVSVNINGETFTPNVANWEYYGVGKNKVGYKLMDMARGKTLDKIHVSAEEKRKMALAYVTIELTNLFKGDVWDIDRHMGQQNFEQISNSEYKINIYDTGAQMNKAPNKTDKILLADVLYGLIRAARTGLPMDQQILKTIKNMDKLEKYLNIDINYVADVQKGLMALSDIIEYQKEIKDKDGNITQERLTLTENDLANAIEAVYENPSCEKTIKMSLTGKVLLNKLRPLRKGWISSLREGIKKKSINPVKVEITPFYAKTNSIHFDKPALEISDIINAENSEKLLGINKKYIKDNLSKVNLDKMMEMKTLQIA